MLDPKKLDPKNLDVEKVKSKLWWLRGLKCQSIINQFLSRGFKSGCLHSGIGYFPIFKEVEFGQE